MKKITRLATLTFLIGASFLSCSSTQAGGLRANCRADVYSIIEKDFSARFKAHNPKNLQLCQIAVDVGIHHKKSSCSAQSLKKAEYRQIRNLLCKEYIEDQTPSHPLEAHAAQEGNSEDSSMQQSSDDAQEDNSDNSEDSSMQQSSDDAQEDNSDNSEDSSMQQSSDDAQEDNQGNSLAHLSRKVRKADVSVIQSSQERNVENIVRHMKQEEDDSGNSSDQQSSDDASAQQGSDNMSARFAPDPKVDDDMAAIQPAQERNVENIVSQMKKENNNVHVTINDMPYCPCQG